VNRFTQETIRIYGEHQIDFHALFAWHIHHGIVFSGFDGFAIGFYTNHEDPDHPVAIEDSDTLFVTMCCGNMRKCLSAFQNDFKFIAFQRSFKNSPRVRIYPMEKFIKSLNK